MYEDAMAAVTAHLIRKSETEELIYTQEIIPERDRNGQMSVSLSQPFFVLTLVNHIASGGWSRSKTT